MEEPRLRDAPKILFTDEEQQVIDQFKSICPDIPPYLIELSVNYMRTHPAPTAGKKRLTNSEKRKIKRGEMEVPEQFRHETHTMEVLKEANEKWAKLKAGTTSMAQMGNVCIPKKAEVVEGAAKCWDANDPECPKYDEQGYQLSGYGTENPTAKGYENAHKPAITVQGEKESQDFLPVKRKVEVIKGAFAQDEEKK
mgnify:CR=1 FL=1|tara:strand:+ start:822 stop:1409 length:588 start_codon:yes stop_codon:yes gene_type:complete